MDKNSFTQTIARFSYKFCHEIQGNSSVVSSPLSAEILLALLTLGSTKNTHAELLKSLGFPNDEAIRSSFSALTTSLKSTEGVTLNVANKVYLMEGNYNLSPKLKEDAVKIFDAAMEKINFGDGALAASVINKWVEDRTNNRIKDLLKSADLNSDTRLVLVNALYFKGTWEKQFDKENTRDTLFHLNNDSTSKIPMMFKSDKFQYGESEALDAQLLEMYYKGRGASMVVVLPRKIEGLRPMLKKLADGFDLMSKVTKIFAQKVDVTIPKFKIETEIDLNDLLPKLGISKIFSPAENGLSGILDNNEPLYVSKAVQKAFIEVNEEGAEAAAATGMAVMMCSALPIPPPKVFCADRPFFYVLRDIKGTPLFVGVFRGQ